MREFDGYEIDWAGMGWYRLERKYAASKPSERIWQKVDAIDHSDPREMTFVEADDVTVNYAAQRYAIAARYGDD